jgi:hypothetical protein
MYNVDSTNSDVSSCSLFAKIVALHKNAKLSKFLIFVVLVLPVISFLTGVGVNVWAENPLMCVISSLLAILALCSAEFHYSIPELTVDEDGVEMMLNYGFDSERG